MTFRDFEKRAADPDLSKKHAEEDRIRRAAERKLADDRASRARKMGVITPWLYGLWVALMFGLVIGGFYYGYVNDDEPWKIPSGPPVEIFGDFMLIILQGFAILAAPFVVVGMPFFLNAELDDWGKPLFEGGKKIAFCVYCYISMLAFSYLAYLSFEYFDF